LKDVDAKVLKELIQRSVKVLSKNKASRHTY